MTWIDWCITIIPMAALIWMAFYSRRYARGVVDYLAAGRIAGRYVISVGDLTAGLSVITLVAGCEQNYQTGFAVGFWGGVTAPVGVFIALTGYCMYRWRETRCLSMGQFLEMRYGSKFFRVFCATLRTIAEMVTNAIGPAIATNFFIYYLTKRDFVCIYCSIFTAKILFAHSTKFQYAIFVVYIIINQLTKKRRCSSVIGKAPPYLNRLCLSVFFRYLECRRVVHYPRVVVSDKLP